MFEVKHLCMVLGGTLLGSAGVKLLSSKDAKKAYTHCVAAVLRGKDCVMKTVDTVQENCEDILSDARSINEDREIKKTEAEFSDVADDVEFEYDDYPEQEDEDAGLSS